MAKERSAISKSMKKTRVSGTHVSGLSSAKSSNKRKAGASGTPKLSRKEQQDLKEYGELIPKDFIDEEEDSSKRRRVISEADLDKELDEEQHRKEHQFDSDEESEDDEEEDWKKPSAYSMLISSLKKNSKQKDFYRKIQLEQEGIEEVEKEHSASEEDDEDVHFQSGSEDMLESDNEDEKEEMKSEEEENEHSDENEEEEIEEEEEIIYQGSDDEEDIVNDDGLDDLFETRFKDAQPPSFDEAISIIEQKKWVGQQFEDNVLHDVVAMTPTPNKSVKNIPEVVDLAELHVKPRIIESWPRTNKQVRKKGQLTPLQTKLFHQMNQYRDVLFCNRNMTNAKAIRNAYVLHAVNHIYKTRDRVMKNSAKLAKAQKEGKDIGEVRDQGFTRPKVLIVLPFRNTVVDIVDSLMKLSGTEQHENKTRFYEQYNLREEEQVDPTKPADFLQNFQGNIDDHFRLGVKFSKKSMKLFSNFYNSDIIIASPLGLRTLIGTEGDKKRDFDYLSSIEIVIMDQTNHFLMQNWEHIEHLFQHMNLIPKDGHGCDISRIKSWHLDGKAKYLRQTLIFADFLTPEFNALFNKHLKNVSGKLKIKQTFEDGTIMDVIPQVQQTFTRIDVPALNTVNDMRFKFFIEKTLPSLRKSALMQSHTLIFIPSYFDFVRVRNYLEDNKYSYEACSEYADASAVTRARARFFQGRTDFLLYSERLHFFRR
ncbi:hypothetical protein BDB01DRAFT_723870 [Pilobolus umbonatus]|nr:hypothetical protein BDB01DRAFT_723870 [Pilobolus umbonatus]